MLKEGSTGQIHVTTSDIQPTTKAGEQADTPLSSMTTETAGEEAETPLSSPTKVTFTTRMRSQSRSRDHSNSPRHTTWTSSSDPYSLSDANDEIISHPGCWLIPIIVLGIQTLAFIDTCASVSMMGRPLYQKTQELSQINLQTKETPRLEGVGGNLRSRRGGGGSWYWQAQGCSSG